MQSDTAAAQSTFCRPGETQAPADLTEDAVVQKPKDIRVYYQTPSLGDGTGVPCYLTGDKARTDPQVAYPAATQKAKAAAAVTRAGYEKWKKAKCLEVDTKTGAIASITWDHVRWHHLQRQAPRQLARGRPGLGSFGFGTSSTPCALTALAWHYPYGDPRRIFGQGTPKEVWYLMEQTWEVVGAPSNARVTEEILGWEPVCERIIEAKGCSAPDENFQTGRRARKVHGEGGRKTKLRKRDRKSTHLLHLPAHPALVGAYEDLLEPEGGGVAAEGP
jgi:hypothetical protein